LDEEYMGLDMFGQDDRPPSVSIHLVKIERPRIARLPEEPRKSHGRSADCLLNGRLRTTMLRNDAGFVYSIEGQPPSRRALRRTFDEDDCRNLAHSRSVAQDDDEKVLLDGLIALSAGEHATALAHIDGAGTIPDAAWLSGMLHLRGGHYEAAEQRFRQALQNRATLSATVKRLPLDIYARLPIAERVVAQISPNSHGALIGLAAVYRRSNRPDDALECLERLLTEVPQDPVVLLYLADLIWRTRRYDAVMLRRLVEITAETTNDTPIHSAILLYKGRVLNRLSLFQTAIHTLTMVLRRPKGRPAEFLHDAQYERAMSLAAKGDRAGAIHDLERLLDRAPALPNAVRALARLQGKVSAVD
jgi:tetratricopeptide (TPR) repeat protein